MKTRIVTNCNHQWDAFTNVQLNVTGDLFSYSSPEWIKKSNRDRTFIGYRWLRISEGTSGIIPQATIECVMELEKSTRELRLMQKVRFIILTCFMFCAPLGNIRIREYTLSSPRPP
mgnify:CR=1 FL=1